MKILFALFRKNKFGKLADFLSTTCTNTFFQNGIKIFLLLISIWGLARFCHHKTEGLRFSKFENNTTCIKEQISPPISEEISSILQKNFHYLGRGLESFSFISDDGKTVLKLFNNRYQKRLSYLKWFPQINRKKKIAYVRNKLFRAFESYQIAFDNMKEETGLLYFHPQTSNQKISVTLFDKLHIAHQVDLAKKGFVLQKKAELAYPYLATCTPEESKEAITSLVLFLKKKMEKGIADRDPLIRTNFGFIKGKPMQIDVGPLSYDLTLKNIDTQKEELKKITLSLKHWLETYHPEKAPYLYEALNNL